MTEGRFISCVVRGASPSRCARVPLCLIENINKPMIESATMRKHNDDKRGYPLAYENLPHR